MSTAKRFVIFFNEKLGKSDCSQNQQIYLTIALAACCSAVVSKKTKFMLIFLNKLIALFAYRLGHFGKNA
jgi:hypothetical protein